MNLINKPSKLKPFHCKLCGRKDVPKYSGRMTNKNIPFHYALCGLPCEGGPIPREERYEHKGSHKIKCPCTA